MKLAKYIAISVIAVLITISILIRVPQVQDRLIEGLAQDALNNPTILPEDSLTAVVCGSRSPFPTPGRAEACILIKAGENYFVVDSGDGSVANLRNWRIPIKNVRVLLTHLHSDHISDLNDLHQATWVAQSRTKKLDVYGPKGVESVTKGFEEAFKGIPIKDLPAPEPQIKEFLHPKDFLALAGAGAVRATPSSSGARRGSSLWWLPARRGQRCAGAVARTPRNGAVGSPEQEMRIRQELSEGVLPISYMVSLANSGWIRISCLVCNGIWTS